MRALLVIDMLNDFVLPHGALPVPDTLDIVNKINTLIEDFRESGDLVIFVNDAHTENDPEFENFPPHCIKGTPGAMVYYGITGVPDEVIEKATYSAFDGTELDNYLEKMWVETITLCGVATDICIKAAAEAGLVRKYNVCVVQDAIKGLTQQAHHSALADMSALGAKIYFTEELCD